MTTDNLKTGLEPAAEINHRRMCIVRRNISIVSSLVEHVSNVTLRNEHRRQNSRQGDEIVRKYTEVTYHAVC
jgi:hypothetical protein